MAGNATKARTPRGRKLAKSPEKRAREQARKELRQERMREALELRRAGASMREIARHMKASLSTVGAMLAEAMTEIIREPAEAVLALELDRLDTMLQAIWPRVETGDDFAIDRALKISKRRAELLGLDAPEQLELSTTEIILDIVGSEVFPAGEAPPLPEDRVQ